MKIKRTTSNKNSWYCESYDENLFGGKIPDDCIIPEGLILDPRMLTDQAKAKIKQGKKKESELLEMVEETQNDLSHHHADDNHADDHHADDHHASTSTHKEDFLSKRTPVA